MLELEQMLKPELMQEPKIIVFLLIFFLYHKAVMKQSPRSEDLSSGQYEP